MICNEEAIAAFQKTFNMQFLEVQGIPMEGGKYNVLVTPIPQMIEPPGEAVPDVQPVE